MQLSAAFMRDLRNMPEMSFKSLLGQKDGFVPAKILACICWSRFMLSKPFTNTSIRAVPLVSSPDQDGSASPA